MSTISRIEDVSPWSVWCATEGAWITGLASTAPNACFTDAAHTIDVIAHPIRRHIVVTRELPFQNAAVYNIDTTTMTRTIHLKNGDSTLLPGFTTSRCVWTSPRYPIAIAGFQCNPSINQEGNVLNAWLYKDLACATLTVEASESANVFTLSSVASLLTGMQLSIDEENLGEVIDVKTSTKQVRTSVSASRPLVIGSIVRISRPLIVDVHLQAGRMTFGEFTPGSMILPPLAPLTIDYENVHGHDDYMNVMIEYQCGSTNLGTI
jgi:hypothetical protein